jgi:hypothetical protein
VLNDRVHDLTSNIDHELRMVTRSLLAELDETLEANDPADLVGELLPMVEQRLFDDVAACHHRLNQAAVELAVDVAALFDDDVVSMDLPLVELGSQLEALSARTIAVDERPSLGNMLFTGVRGSYSGVAVFGMIFGFTGGAITAVALAPASLAAGAYFGQRTARQERERSLKLRRQQAKQEVRKAVEEVSIRITKHTRDALKQVHREIRDANLARAKELRRTNTHALDAAKSALRASQEDRAARTSEIEAALAQLSIIDAALAKIEST